MKIKIKLGIGLANCRQVWTEEWDDDDWNGMTDEARDAALLDIVMEKVDWSYEEAE